MTTTLNVLWTMPVDMDKLNSCAIKGASSLVHALKSEVGEGSTALIMLGGKD